MVILAMGVQRTVPVNSAIIISMKASKYTLKNGAAVYSASPPDFDLLLAVMSVSSVCTTLCSYGENR